MYIINQNNTFFVNYAAPKKDGTISTWSFFLTLLMQFALHILFRMHPYSNQMIKRHRECLHSEVIVKIHVLPPNPYS